MMKILSVIIPCYNSQDYMARAIDSVIAGGDEVEVIVIDDGSTDRTAEIADDYAEKYPSIVKVIHKENGGHGSGINYGLKAATGHFFKVVDSDDRVDEDALLKVLDVLRKAIDNDMGLDMLLTNYVYDKQGAKHKFVMKCKGIPKNRLISWDDVKRIRKYHYILMHSIIYRTDLLRLSGLELPEHTYYVDNIYAFTPMMYVKTMYYCNVPLYRYFIGRSDQSVNEKVMVGRMDQQIRVTKIMIDSYRPELAKNKNMASYMIHDMGIIMSVTSILLLRIGTDAALEQKKEIWNYLKKKDLVMYLRIRHSVLGRALNIPTKAGRDIAVKGYQLVQKYYGFN